MRAQTLREWRGRVGLTQAQAAPWWDYTSQSRYSRFESGRDGHDTSRRFVVAAILEAIRSEQTLTLPQGTPCLAALAMHLGG
ncbi:MAG: helix-turn-helix domain-containing protein [Epibacterium sp.]|nr:helix-turn-helix domain-containing protein [Epibacterium sp.]